MTKAGFVLWFVGRPAAGKSTIANLLHERLANEGITSCVLDSDELRTILTPQPTYSDQERDWFYAALVGLAGVLSRNGVHVLIAATGQRQAYRAAAYAQLPQFAEVYVQCSLSTCQERDPKGLYARAQTGAIAQLPGAGAVFEPPLAPALIIDTEQQAPAAAVELLLVTFRQHFTQ